MPGKKRDVDLDRLIGKVIDYEGALKHMQNGMPISEACRKFNVDYEEMRRFLGTEHLDFSYSSISRAKIADSKCECLGYERLYMALLGHPCKNLSDIPYDVDKGFMQAFKTLTPREVQIIKEYYLGCMTQEQVAAHHNLTKERIRQILAKAERKLRQPQRKRMWKDGWEVYKKLEEMRKANSQITYSEKVEEFESHVRDVVEQKDKEKMLEIYYDLKRLVESSDYEEARLKRDNNNVPIIEMELSVRSYNCLKHSGINYIKDLEGMKLSKLLKIRNLGRKSLEEILDKCQVFGISIVDDITKDEIGYCS